MIEMDGERELGKSMLSMRLDDDDDDDDSLGKGVQVSDLQYFGSKLGKNYSQKWRHIYIFF